MNEEFKIVLNSLKNKRLRAWLTIIGILIGIAAVVALISLGQGFNAAIGDEFQKVGGDKIIITPSTASGLGMPSDTNKLSVKDKKLVKSISGVKEATLMFYTSSKIEWKDQAEYYGITTLGRGDERRLIESMQSFNIINGRDLKDADSYKALAGHDYAKEGIFNKKLNVGDNVLINNVRFKIVGRLGSFGNKWDDRTIYIPEDTFKKVFNVGDDDADYLFVQIADSGDKDRIVDSIKRKLRKSHDVDEGDEDFVVQTPEDIMEGFSNIFLIVNIVLIGIAGISLLVGGVGIANTMYTSILERTREIGVMKAIGARKKNIVLIFMIEAGLLGLIGGVLGAIVGAVVSQAVAIIGSLATGTTLLRAETSVWLLLGAVLFAFIIGCIAGVIPAYQAAKLDPVEALRYE